MVSELIAGTVDRKTLNKWKETKKSFVYKPKGRTFYYIDGKRFRLSQLKINQVEELDLSITKYDRAKYISKIKKIYYQEKKIKRKKVKKKKPEKRLQMWRLTLCIADLQGNLRFAVHKKYYSMKVQMWSVDKSKLRNKQSDLSDELIKKLKKKTGWKTGWENWFDFEPNVCYDEVDYNQRLEGKIEETDEFLQNITKRRQKERFLKAEGLDSPDWF